MTLEQRLQQIAEENGYGAEIQHAMRLAAEAAMEWMPIDSAPKDGTKILLLRETGPVVGLWKEDKYSNKPKPYWDHDKVRLFGIHNARNFPPTHWQPLPPPPEVKP